MRNVLFVCTANVCRSPMAAGILEALAGDRGLGLRARSAGTAALVGEPATREARRVLDDLGIDLGDHRARQVDGEMVRGANLVLVMTPRHRETLHRNFEEHREKIWTLPEYATGDGDAGIADPYGYDLSIYRASAREILRQVQLVLGRLEIDGEAAPARR